MGNRMGNQLLHDLHCHHDKHKKKCNLQRKDCIFSRATHGGNGDHVELRSCGLQSKDDDVCLHWETHVVQWKAARKENAIFKGKIAFFLVFIMVAMEIM